MAQDVAQLLEQVSQWDIAAGFSWMRDYIESNGLDCSCRVGAMTRKNCGLTSLTKRKALNAVSTHCIVHRKVMYKFSCCVMSCSTALGLFFAMSALRSLHSSYQSWPGGEAAQTQTHRDTPHTPTMLLNVVKLNRQTLLTMENRNIESNGMIWNTHTHTQTLIITALIKLWKYIQKFFVCFHLP